MRPKNRKAYGVWRHKLSQIAGTRLYLDVIPREKMPSLQAQEFADAAQSFLEQVITDPQKRFYSIRREMIAWMLAARQGAYKIEFDRRIGPFGDIRFSCTDTRNLRWADGYHPHDPLCPWFYEKARIRTDLIQFMDGWKNTDNLRGDSGSGARSTYTSGAPGTVVLGETAGPTLEASREFTYTTVVYLYERNVKISKRVPGGRKKLKSADRYMVCRGPDETGCGYRSDTQKDQQKNGELGPGEELPDMMPGACPGLEEGMTCGLDLERVDHEDQEFEVEGEHRFTIFAPYEVGTDGNQCRVFVEPEPWPGDTRTVPYVISNCYVRPFRPMGQSESSINKSYVLGIDLMDRMGLETMMLSRPYWAVPNVYTDFNGERWQFGDEQGLCAYYDPFAGNAAPMQILQPPGLPAAWATLRGALENDLREDMGTNDISFGPGQSKDIPVGTAQRLERLGEVPVDDQIEQLRWDEAFGMMFLLDLIRANYTEKRLLRMKGKDGARIFTLMRGADLPDMDVLITTDPNALEIQGEQVDNLLKVFNAPPPIRKQIARALNISPTAMKEFEQEMQEWEAEQAAKLGPPPGMGGPPGGLPGPPPPLGGRLGPPPGLVGAAPPMNGAAG